ncbi:hypothetical protein [Caulobacter segnis]|uniref:Uncharacterized protein n=1 Tax=Caulobacter segnis TaxID=88688 RepID=A0A2W5V1N9_9CAUL|nr:hypothetical protein [Caulobacter segnis]PZR33999.1 MAG: hypothetical protein DI526_11610 [Caulobacter segnis]
MKLALILLGLLSAPTAAERTPGDVLARLAEKVDHSEAYRPNGLDPRRGVVLTLTADPIGDAICRAQKLFVFYKRDAGEGVDRVEVQNRYHVEDWTARHAAPPRSCDGVADAQWTVAQDDRTFRSVLPAIGQVYRLTAQAQPASRYPFKFICRDYAKACADPAAKLKEAFALGVDEVDQDGAIIWARRTAYGMAPHWDMKIELSSGAISTVTLSFTPPPLS